VPIAEVNTIEVQEVTTFGESCTPGVERVILQAVDMVARELDRQS